MLMFGMNTKIKGTYSGTKMYKDGKKLGVTPRLLWVMSPTSYRAAPPRTELTPINLIKKPNISKGAFPPPLLSVHTVHTAWDQIGDQAQIARGAA
jgi:hypothetical protein